MHAEGREGGGDEKEKKIVVDLHLKSFGFVYLKLERECLQVKYVLGMLYSRWFHILQYYVYG